ncbi:hypothetical protein QVD17_04585 [Tagetes erecta]|uniref:Uncharacterized protein n=1 Tax=Tagetes erecta TaxID=13708 RepID=A0AAD8LJU8_TARER|nr:hypothetical protein QVD17_04585 [Tagetes erecta]
MGACISIHHKASKKNVQVSFDHHKPVIHSTNSNRQYYSAMDGLVAVKPQLPPSASLPRFSDYGSKDEVFFDSQAWLDSDYEDEFLSVNGDFTPSRGNTPVHHSLAPSRANTFMNRVEFIGIPGQPSPTSTEKKKRLLDLFKESQRDNNGSPNYQLAELPKTYGVDMGTKKDGLQPKRERPAAGFMQGCFKSLLSFRCTGKQNKKRFISGLKLARSPVVGS